MTMKNLWRAKKGAVYVEFLIVFLPLFTMFMSLVQYGYVAAAALVARHAAENAARAAVVIIPDDPAYYQGNAVYSLDASSAVHRLEAINAAANTRLLAVTGLPIFSLSFPSSPGGSDSKTSFGPDDVVRVQIKFQYQCGVPIGRMFVCSDSALGFLTGGLLKTLKAEAAFPMQGARFTY
jgi:hypothetical protein